MDINQFDWVMVKRKPNFLRGTLQRSIVLVPLFAVMTVLIVTFSFSDQRIFKKEELLIMLEVILFITIAVINSIWHLLMQATPDKLIHYKVDGTGISREKKKIALNALKNTRVEEMLTKNALPYQQWRKSLPENVTFVELILDTNQGKMTMTFPGEYERQKFIRTLQEYLHPTPITELKN